MASGQQSDMEVSGDWTLVSSPEEDKMVASTGSSQLEGNKVEVITEDENTRNTVREEELSSLPDGAAAEKDEANDHSRDSDIDILDDDMDERLQSLESSAVTQTSASLSFSEISAANTASSYENLEVLPDDASEAASTVLSDASLPPGLDLRPGVRRYRHVPNARLNITLSVMAALVAAAAIGLGIGHYLGWSDKFFQQKEMTHAQIGKLKQLQDELIICMQQQKQNKGSSADKDPLVCYEDNEYWKQKFENLFSENKGLKELLEQSQRNAVLTDVRVDALDEGQCEDDDVHKLKLDLILNQMQHLQLMKTFNEVRHQERQTRERARMLEEENKELKQRLVEEEEEDTMLRDLEGKVKNLREENAELKAHLKEDTSRQETLLSLESQVQLLHMENEQLQHTLKEIQHNEEEEQQTITARLSQLKDKVNQLATENEDLKAIIAKLRYGQPPPVAANGDQHEQHRQKISDLRRQNGNLEVEIEKKRNSQPEGEDEGSDSNQDLKLLLELLKNQHMEAKHWRKLYEDLQSKGANWNNLSSVNWTELLNNGTEAASNAVSVLLGRLKKMSLGTKVSEKISQVKDSFGSLRNIITERWEQLQQSMNSPASDAESGTEEKSRIVADMARAVENSLKKVYDASNKFLSVLDKSVEMKATKLTSKLWKAMDTLNKKLYEMAHEKPSTAEEENVDDVDVEDDPPPHEDDSHRDEHSETGEHFAKDHRHEHALPEKKEEESAEADEGEVADEDAAEMANNWFSGRAKSRAEQRFSEEARNENWFLRRQGENWRETKQASRDGKRKGWKPRTFSSDDEDEAYFRSRRR
ncbi:girdin-like [Ornithodoros turicata]|uniref:girdin-like n=1 Tax=Ornithodoros turicata TaxID=34597 RepID=UPI0031387170